MSRTKHGHSWIARHINDPFVKKAQQAGYRSRSTFKLLELHQKYKLFRPKMVVIDLGAAPGGWSQILRECVPEGKLIALDKLEMPPLKGVEFIQADFTEVSTLESLNAALTGQSVDWILSDMAPNLSGLTAVDQPRILFLAELALDFAQMHLKQGGGFLVKVFQGAGFDDFLKSVRQRFKQVNIYKPQASRTASRELYVLARDYIIKTI